MPTIGFGLLFIYVFCVKRVSLLENGLARTPPMGWMSWGYYKCGLECDGVSDKCLNEELIMSVADTFFAEGYQEAGFEYIIIDDCWSEKKRVNGSLVADKIRFPRGMKFLADYIHSRGLKFGMYTNIAKTTCMGYPGLYHHMMEDMNKFSEWGIDYIKVDGCYSGQDLLNTAYVNFGKQIKASGRPIVYSCSWPYYIQYIHVTEPDYAKVAKTCNLWRNFHDVDTDWSVVRLFISHYIQQYETISPYHGPGHWNDPDMLIFGTESLTLGQSKVHIAFHAMFSAPLLLSCNMKKMLPFEKELLTNLDLIAVAQDALGIMAKPFKLKDSVTLLVKRHLPMKGDIYHSFSFALINVDADDSSISFTPGLYGMNSTDGYYVMDVFSRVSLNNITINESLSVIVRAEDAVMYTMFPI